MLKSAKTPVNTPIASSFSCSNAVALPTNTRRTGIFVSMVTWAFAVRGSFFNRGLHALPSLVLDLCLGLVELELAAFPVLELEP